MNVFMTIVCILSLSFKQPKLLRQPCSLLSICLVRLAHRRESGNTGQESSLLHVLHFKNNNYNTFSTTREMGH